MIRVQRYSVCRRTVPEERSRDPSSGPRPAANPPAAPEPSRLLLPSGRGLPITRLVETRKRAEHSPSPPRWGRAGVRGSPLSISRMEPLNLSANEAFLWAFPGIWDLVIGHSLGLGHFPSPEIPLVQGFLERGFPLPFEAATPEVFSGMLSPAAAFPRLFGPPKTSKKPVKPLHTSNQKKISSSSAGPPNLKTCPNQALPQAGMGPGLWPSESAMPLMPHAGMDGGGNNRYARADDPQPNF